MKKVLGINRKANSNSVVGKIKLIIMKKLVLVLLVLGCFTVLMSFTDIMGSKSKTEKTILSDYCDGWEDGYCEGWKDVKGSLTVCPVTPVCPVAEVGKDGYRGGYNRGFKAGMTAARN